MINIEKNYYCWIVCVCVCVCKQDLLSDILQGMIWHKTQSTRIIILEIKY